MMRGARSFSTRDTTRHSASSRQQRASHASSTDIATFVNVGHSDMCTHFGTFPERFPVKGHTSITLSLSPTHCRVALETKLLETIGYGWRSACRFILLFGWLLAWLIGSSLDRHSQEIPPPGPILKSLFEAKSTFQGALGRHLWRSRR